MDSYIAMAAEAESGEQVVTPWEAHAAEGQAAIDYGKLISEHMFM